MIDFESDVNINVKDDALKNISELSQKLVDLETKMPQLQLRQYLSELTGDFKENPFEPLDELWERELSDLFDDPDDS